MSLQDYHKPDSRWEIFGKPDFETYKRDYVVKGVFHSDVRKDIIDAYEVAEYMMAHAYYLYPLYDEAVSKVLRISEMAVKLRCSQLGVSFESKVFNKKLGNYNLKSLKNLMDDLCVLEPNKNFRWQFEVSVDLRNSYMHPSRHTFMGGMSYGFIQRGVTLLNKIFLPNELFICLEEKLSEMQFKLKLFQNKPFFLLYKDIYYLVDNIRIEAAVIINGKWIYCFICSPIFKNIKDHMKKHSYPPAFSFQVMDVEFKDGFIIAKQIESEEIINISPIKDISNNNIYNSFVKDKRSASIKNKEIYLNSYHSDVAKKINEFEYNYMHKLKI